MNLDPIFMHLLASGGLSGVLIAASLMYLALQVRGLQRSVDAVQVTIGEKVFPRLDDHTNRIATLEGRYANAELMRKEDR